MKTYRYLSTVFSQVEIFYAFWMDLNKISIKTLNSPEYSRYHLEQVKQLLCFLSLKFVTN